MSTKTYLIKAEAIALGVLLAASGDITAAATSNLDLLQNSPQQPATKVTKPQWASGELLVKYKGVKIPNELPETGKLSAMRSILPAAADQVMGMLQAEVVAANSMTGLVHVRFKANMSVQEAASLLMRTGSVAYAEPNYRVKGGQAGVIPITADAPRLAIAAAAVTPNDPRFAEQWALNNTGQTGGEADADIDAREGWGLRTDASTTIVGVLGSGIAYTHVDLAANRWTNPGEVCNNGVDDDSNGYKDDCYGIDAYLNSGNPLDDNGWGTHMAGIVGAVGNNAKGIAGVAWKAKLMGLRFLDADGWGWVADAVQCIDYAIKIKDKNSYPRMVLLSDQITGPYSKALYDILKTAETKGILVVTGSRSSNDNQDIWPWYPGSYGLPNIITVSSSNETDRREGAGYGYSSVDLAAPGTNILSTWLANTYKLGSGTSLAAAHVAGASALVWSKNPTMNWKHVKGLILNSAEDGLHGSFYWGYSLTEGRLNLNSSLSVSPTVKPAVFAVNPALTQQGQNITITGINFGNTATGRSIKLIGDNCTYAYPAASIVSWANEKIVTKVPGTCRWGEGLLTVNIGTTQAARGAYFRVNPNPDNSLRWLSPTYQGRTLMEHTEAASAQIGSDIWIIGGRSFYNEQTGSIERFSLLTMRGEVRPEWEMPMPVIQAGAAAIGNKIYVVGGFDDNSDKYVSALQIFDTTTGIWTRGRNLPQALSQPSVVSVSNKLWVIGGRDPNNTGLKTTYLYDPTANTWATKAPLPLKRAYAGVATPVAGQIWLVSGYTESGGSWYRTKDVLAYTISANTWDIRDDIPLQGEHAAGGVINIGGKVFALYGDGDWGAGEWLVKPGPAAGLAWFRNIDRQGSMGTYTPMLGKLGNTVYMISGSREHQVFKFESP